jgi:hypothetical protein
MPLELNMHHLDVLSKEVRQQRAVMLDKPPYLKIVTSTPTLQIYHLWHKQDLERSAAVTRLQKIASGQEPDDRRVARKAINAVVVAEKNLTRQMFQTYGEPIKLKFRAGAQDSLNAQTLPRELQNIT